MERYTSSCEQDTFLLGRQLGKTLKPGDTVAFYGGLGAGKTAFTRGIAAAFGISGVCSPTFAIVNEYHGPDAVLYHFDAYRLDADAWLDGGFDEYLYSGGICLIEWAENLDGILPPETVRIAITRDLKQGDCFRNIEVER